MSRTTLALAALAACVAIAPGAEAKQRPKPKPKPVERVLTLAAPVATWGRTVVLEGKMTPPARGARVRISLAGRVFTHALVGPRGGFRVTVRVRSRGPYRAGFYTTVSEPLLLRVRSRLQASLVGDRTIGSSLALYAQLSPRGAGSVRVEVRRSGKRTFAASYRRGIRVKLGTSGFGELSVRLSVTPSKGFAAPQAQVLKARLVPPQLRYGSTGPAVAELLRRLAGRHYAVADVHATEFGDQVLDTVYAFQKVQGLERDGVVGPRFWRALDRPRVPRPRYPSGDHLEVDKTHQVLLVVRGGAIVSIVPVSTAGISGYSTPEGAFSIYRKVPGFDPSPLGTLYLPMYFTGGYAVHGNPSVPPYPASHGCIRVPMWEAERLYESEDYGTTVYVYS